jgi:glycosyltransferase involved in cell wall biosynthesis
VNQGTPLVSVLMPVHNGGDFLDAAIDSILSQTETDLELVAVENGSTDGSLAVLRRHATRDTRVRVIEAGQVGLVAALNLGLAAATGRYLARMDADDLAEPDRLAVQLAHLRAHPEIGVLGTAYDYIDAAGTRVGSRRFVTSPELVAASLYFGNPLAHPTVTIDRRRTGELQYTSGFPDAEDLALWRMLSRRGVALANLDRVLLHYRVHAAGATDQNSAQVGRIDVDAIVDSSRWRADRARWAIARTFNARARGVRLWAFLAGVTALNLLNLRLPEVTRAALARRSALGIAAWLRQADRNRR